MRQAQNWVLQTPQKIHRVLTDLQAELCSSSNYTQHFWGISASSGSSFHLFPCSHSLLRRSSFSSNISPQKTQTKPKKRRTISKEDLLTGVSPGLPQLSTSTALIHTAFAKCCNWRWASKFRNAQEGKILEFSAWNQKWLLLRLFCSSMLHIWRLGKEDL